MTHPECQHEFTWTEGMAKDMCRCLRCQQTFPIGMYLNSLQAQILKRDQVIKLFQQDRAMLESMQSELVTVKHQQALLERKFMSIVTEPVEVQPDTPSENAGDDGPGDGQIPSNGPKNKKKTVKKTKKRTRKKSK